MFRNPLLRSVLFVGCLALYACSESSTVFEGECSKNGDCPVGAYCKKTRDNATGICACRSDEACAEGEICNSEGVCQKRTGCRSNVECDVLKFCNIATGECLDKTKVVNGNVQASCGADVHCVPGQVCDPANGVCVDGCYDTADCGLYAVCDRTGLTSPQQFGTCLRGRCDGSDFCPYGQICSNNACQAAPSPWFCADCDPRSPDACGDPDNFCLINSSYDPSRPQSGGPNFCGVDCAMPSDCPSGYDCGGVILLTQDQCTSDPACGGGGRRCILGEGDLRGFCTCVDDADCAFDSVPPTCAGTCGGLGITPCQDNSDCLALPCDLNNRTCQWPTGQACTDDSQCQPLPICAPIGAGGGNVCITDAITPCTSSADCLCSNGRCVNTGRSCTTGAQCNPPCQDGGCFLGRACAPLQGLLCPDVRP